MTRRILDLSTLAWQFGSCPRRPFTAQPADDRAAVAEWLPATVPGDVRGDLIAAGRIPPVETPAGIAAGAWVDDCDWWWRVRFSGDLGADDVALLEADGIDYFSAIWLDKQRLATHAGMFSRQVVDLTTALRAAGRGPHELAIRIWGGGALSRPADSRLRRAIRRLVAALSPSTEYFPDRLATPKAQFGFGWDFAPRLLSTGVWDEIRLVTCRGAYIADLWAQAEPLPEGWRGRRTAELVSALARVRVQIKRWQAGPLRAEVTVAPEGDAAPIRQETLDLSDDRNLSLDLDLPAVRPWWPWDHGEPNLCRVTVRLLDEGGVLDEACQLIGVRSVERAPFPDGSKWRWLINGRPVFLRGANWTPVDVLPGRAAPADYARLLGLARAAGVNFLRVWGGGVREKRIFWEYCNRLGIMAWQEFPLACAFLDHYPRDPADLDVLAHEARGAVRALRSHPSLIAWCGGNEINPAREHAPLGRLRAVLAEADPSRPFIPASPSAGDVHQWQVWHGLAPWTDYAAADAPFMSEFGLQALPDATTVAEMFPEGAPISLDDPRWAARKAQIAKLRRYAGPTADQGLAAAIEQSQRSQAAGLQAGIEACRLRRGPGAAHPCGGVAFWQFNEPWPAVSWSVVDHAGRPKAAYAMLCRAYQPVLIAARFAWRRYRAGDAFRAEIWLVNDGPETWEECRAAAAIDTHIVWQGEGCTLAGGSAARVGGFTARLATPPGRLDLTLTVQGRPLAANTYDLGVHLPGRQPLKAQLIHHLSDLMLKTS